MFTFELKCPHCQNQEHFKIVQPVAYHLTKNATYAGHTIDFSAEKILTGSNFAKSYGVAACPRQNCQGPVLIWFETTNLAFRQEGYGSESKQIYAGPPPKVLGSWPEAACLEDSENWPQKIRKVFCEIQEDVQKNREPARIVGACRSVLEVALASLGYDKARGKNLSDRIDEARVDGVLTENMRKWAHKTRMDGNEALHELEASHEEAQELVNFLKTFLDISFDLPKRIDQLSFDQKSSQNRNLR